MGAFSWLIQNHTNLFSALFAIHAAAVVIVNMTPTPKDDEIVGKAYKLIEMAAGIFTKIAKK
jgi:hypothetical protein